MKCNDFWMHYEQSGLTPELEQHLAACKNCRNEMKIETLIDQKTNAFPGYEAPEGLWEKISDSLELRPVPVVQKVSLMTKIVDFLEYIKDAVAFSVYKPAFAVASIALIVLAAGLSYYYLQPRFLNEMDRLSLLAASEEPIDDIEQQYIAEILKYTELVESSKDQIDSDFYYSYQEKLVLLRDYISQCKDALNVNEYSPNVRKYLLIAYEETSSTLKELYDMKSS